MTHVTFKSRIRRRRGQHPYSNFSSICGDPPRYCTKRRDMTSKKAGKLLFGMLQNYQTLKNSIYSGYFGEVNFGTFGAGKAIAM